MRFTNNLDAIELLRSFDSKFNTEPSCGNVHLSPNGDLTGSRPARDWCRKVPEQMRPVFCLLVQMTEAGEPVPLSLVDIALWIGSSTTRIKRALQPMISRGLIRTADPPTPKRCEAYVLTVAGAEYIQRLLISGHRLAAAEAKEDEAAASCSSCLTTNSDDLLGDVPRFLIS